jgi:hypothetical protein
MIHLHRDQADALAESHRHQDVQEWSGDLDDSRAQLIDQVQIDFVLRSGAIRNSGLNAIENSRP